MKKILYAVLTLAILVGSAYAVAAGPGPGGHMHGPEGLLKAVLSLKLTDAQKHDVAVILKNHRAQFETNAQAMGEAFKGVREVMRSDPGNEQLVRQASRKVAAAGEEMAVLRGKVVAELKAVLTPEQRKLWEDQTEPLPGHFKERLHAGRELVNEWIDAHAGQGK